MDETYQSLTVSVPVSIDGTSVDATDAPILFYNAIGGYLPSSVSSATGVSGTLGELALAAGYVVVQPGARGRTLVNSSGECYGTAPAAIVDLKAAVRYVRYNAGTIPGDTDKIVTAGTSAGGALSALLGASGASSLWLSASGCWSPSERRSRTASTATCTSTPGGWAGYRSRSSSPWRPRSAGS